jgi:glycosyltransferase involved in cell wall biosynthesis
MIFDVKAPLVSVGIPTYNRKELVKEAVQSVFDQDYPTIEIVVVDDGSTDGTKQELWKVFGSRIHYVYQEHGGKSRARNRSVIESQGELICFLDSDDILFPHAISANVKCFLKNERCQVSYGISIREGEDNKLEDSLLDSNYPSGYILKEHIKNPFICNNDFMLRREDMINFGMYREDLTNLEDFELLSRLTFRLYFCFCNAYISRVRARGQRARDDFRSKIIQGTKAEDYIFADQELANVLAKEKSRLYGRAFLRLAKASIKLNHSHQFRLYFKKARQIRPNLRWNFKFWRRWLLSWILDSGEK